jgi:alpha-mannosidase
LLQAEKIASLAYFFNGQQYPRASIDEAWKSLLLALHHDCWIVPYNGQKGNTWADKVVSWTGNTTKRSNDIIKESMKPLAEQSLKKISRNIRRFQYKRESTKRVGNRENSRRMGRRKNC